MDKKYKSSNAKEEKQEKALWPGLALRVLSNPVIPQRRHIFYILVHSTGTATETILELISYKSSIVNYTQYYRDHYIFFIFSGKATYLIILGFI